MAPVKKTKTKQPPVAWIGAGVVVLLIILAYAVLPMLNAAPATGWKKDVGVSEAVALRDSGAFVLDVRTPAEWEEGHIPGATLIPLDELAARVSEVPAGKQVLVYCRSGNRSQSGRDILLAAGYEEVTSLNGGIKAWQAAGQPVISGP